MNSLKILVIDDEKLIRWSFEKQLKGKGHKVYTAESGEEGIKLFEQYFPDLVFVDNRLPKMQGLEVIKTLKSIDESVNIVFISAYGSIDSAVSAMKYGAFEYINKPFNFEEVNIVIEQISNKINLDNEVNILRRLQTDDISFSNIVCQSPKLQEVIDISRKIAHAEITTILLLGESGTGKDIFARAIHNENNRNKKSFVTINCSSLPETLLESELFGYEKGAFTDAKKLKKGLFEIADGGTVFLDEIGEINLTTQVKLLNVLESRSFRRLGGTVSIPVDVRIIAATNKNIEQAIIDKTFREDLYYRLKVFQINIPPLRDRKEDIPALIDHFIKIFNLQFGKKVNGVTNDAKNKLLNYHWPGNIRELRNVLERAVILESDDIIHTKNLPGEISKIKNYTNSNEMNLNFEIPEEGISLVNWEKEIIRQALQKANNNQTKAAKLLGISRDTLRYKQKKYNL